MERHILAMKKLEPATGLRRLLPLVPVTLLLTSCAQMQVNHYLPSGDGELRNRSLCTYGLRDELELPLKNGVKIRVWGGDPDTTALSARVQMLVPQGQNMRFMTSAFTLYSKGAAEPAELHTTGITTFCAPDAKGCQSRFAPTDFLEGGTTISDNMLKTAEPKTYRLDLSVPVAPGQTYTLKLPDVEVNGQVQTGLTVRFDKTSTPAATNLSVCQS